jgi:hypothetical protein
VWHDGDEEKLVNNYASKATDNNTLIDNGQHMSGIVQIHVPDIKYFQANRFYSCIKTVSKKLWLQDVKCNGVNCKTIIVPPPDTFLI